jgi:hypothetical protein
MLALLEQATTPRTGRGDRRRARTGVGAEVVGLIIAALALACAAL